MPNNADTLARLGARLRRLRDARHWSLAEVALRSGFTASHISDVERGQKNLSVMALATITEALGEPSLERAFRGLSDSGTNVRATRSPKLPAPVERLAQNVAALPKRKRAAVIRALTAILDAAR